MGFRSPVTIALILVNIFFTNAFTSPATKNAFTIARMAADDIPDSPLASGVTDNVQQNSPYADDFVERGVSFDQDGKSNVWAIEPKMELDNKSSEEKGASLLLHLVDLLLSLLPLVSFLPTYLILIHFKFV